MSWAFNIPFQVVKGESMKTVTLTENCSTMVALANHINTLLGGTKFVAVLKGEPRNNQGVMVYGYGTDVGSRGIRFKSNQYLEVTVSASYTCDCRVGDVYVVIEYPVE